MTDSRLYQVELSIEGTVYVEVRAEDEDAARDAAVEEWRDQVSVGDVEVGHVHVESYRLVTS